MSPTADATAHADRPYRGRIAPTPSGPLHLGHARTFWTAQQRASERRGTLVLRIEDLDPDRCRPEFAEQAIEDLRWFGFTWQEGPDVGGPFSPYVQSQRRDYYATIFRQLIALGAIYPSPHSRKDIAAALVAPHDDPQPPPAGITEAIEEQESVFPPALRPASLDVARAAAAGYELAVNWRFRVPDGEVIAFEDGRRGRVERRAGMDFGDFLVWRKDGYPSYELAVVCDDRAMQISEVVRGEDLLTSTARQLLLFRALGWQPPRFYHCPLVRDAAGRRLAKRTAALSLRERREAGRTPEELRARWDAI